jgi:hypothetical protein
MPPRPRRTLREKILRFFFGASEGYHLQRNLRVTLLAVGLGVVIAALAGLAIYLAYAHPGQGFQAPPP